MLLGGASTGDVDLFCGLVTQTLLSQSCAVESVEELLDLVQFVLQQLQADDSVQVAVVLLLQHGHVLLQLGQTTLQAQEETLEMTSLQGERPSVFRIQTG